MNRDLDSILEQSLSQIEAGKARIQSCLVSYPALADVLEPLLHAAQALWTAPKGELSPEARARIEARVLGKTSTQPRSRPARKQRAWFHPSWQWAFGTLGAILMLMLLTTASLACAASDALPCSSLYPVKLATEDAWLWLAPERDKARLHLRLAHRRPYEVEAMLRQGSFEPSALEALTTHTEAAMQAAEALPVEQALPVLADLIGFTAYQNQMLSGLMDDAPSQRGLN